MKSVIFSVHKKVIRDTLSFTGTYKMLLTDKYKRCR